MNSASPSLQTSWFAKTSQLAGRSLQPALLVLALCLTVIGARFLMIQTYGTDVPIWDQWQGEWVKLYKPYLEGTLTTADFFAAHNEHRILLTRLLALGLFIDNGQWDGRLQMVVNTFLLTFVAAGVFLLGRRQFRGPSIYAWWLVVTLCFSLPYGWENTLSGFQSQFYMMSGFSLLLLWIGTTQKLGPIMRAFGLVVIALPLFFTMASGFLSAAALFAILMADGVRNVVFRQKFTEKIIPVVALFAIIIAGLLLVNHVETHNIHKATSVGHLLNGIAKCFAWPLSEFTSVPTAYAVAFLFWLPWLALFLRCAFSKEPLKPAHAFILALGLWAGLQMAASTYSRANLPPFPASRYMDTFVFGILANFLALCQLPRLLPRGCCQPRLYVLAALLWTGFIGLGFTLLTKRNVEYDMPKLATQHGWQRENVEKFIATGDESHIKGKTAPYIPLPESDVLLKILQDPLLPPYLPAGARRPLALTEIPVEDAPGFAEDGIPAKYDPLFPWVRGSYRAERGGLASTGYYRAFFKTSGKFPAVLWMIHGPTLHDVAITLQAKKQPELRVTPINNADHSWQPAIVNTPKATYQVTAVDWNSGQWMAFSAPKEIGHLSAKALFALSYGQLLLFWGLGIFAIISFFDFWKRQFSTLQDP